MASDNYDITNNGKLSFGVWRGNIAFACGDDVVLVLLPA